MGRSHTPARASDVPEDPQKRRTPEHNVLLAWWEHALAGVAAIVLMMLLYGLIVTLRAPILSRQLIDTTH